MCDTFNQIIQSRSFEKVGPFRAIRGKNFSNELIWGHDLSGDLFGDLPGQLMFSSLNFVNCDFVELDLSYSKFMSCTFTNCNFIQTRFFKAELNNCNFKNCKIFQSDLGRADFMISHFIDCKFDDLNMLGSYFKKCEFTKPKFKNIRFLESVTLAKSKIWNSEGCIEVKSVDNVSKIIDELEE